MVEAVINTELQSYIEIKMLMSSLSSPIITCITQTRKHTHTHTFPSLKVLWIGLQQPLVWMRGPAGPTLCSPLQVSYRILCYLLYEFMGHESILRQSKIIICFSLSSFVLTWCHYYFILSLNLLQSQTNQPIILFSYQWIKRIQGAV
jgi:hypothetical protein